MFESPVKQNLQSPEGARRPAANYSVLLVLARGHDPSRSANAVSAENRKFSLPLCHLAPSLGVTPFDFRIYGKALLILKLESSTQPMVKIWRS